jgi:AcrR family transcriptional regulator
MTRDDILEAAAQIFSQKGYHATSMQDIAAAVHVQKASLYHHIASKQEILLDLLDLALDMLIQRLSQVVDQSLPPPDKIRLAMRTYLQALAEYKELAFVLLLEYRSLEPEQYRRHLPRRDRFESLWRDLIKEGCECGYFRCDNPALAARGLLGVMNWTITWYRSDGPLAAGEIAERFADLILMGLVSREVIPGNGYPPEGARACEPPE